MKMYRHKGKKRTDLFPFGNKLPRQKFLTKEDIQALKHLKGINNKGVGGRPRVGIAPEIVLNAFHLNNNSIRGTARVLGITAGTCFARLKEMGAAPLGTGKGGKKPGQMASFINRSQCEQLEGRSRENPNLPHSSELPRGNPNFAQCAKLGDFLAHL